MITRTPITVNKYVGTLGSEGGEESEAYRLILHPEIVAECLSSKCARDRIKDVSKHAIDCPDCGSALFWHTKKSRSQLVKERHNEEKKSGVRKSVVSKSAEKYRGTKGQKKGAPRGRRTKTCPGAR